MTSVKVGSDLLGLHAGVAVHVDAATIVVEMAEPPPAFAVVVVVFQHGAAEMLVPAMVQEVEGRRVVLQVLPWREPGREGGG